MPNSGNISLGPGVLHTAILGTAEPTDITTALPVDYVEVGYTAEGSEFTYEFTTDPVEVAESLDPVFFRTTGRSGSVNFAMAEMTVKNLVTAFNGGTVTPGTSGAPTTYEPPEPGAQVRKMLVWTSEDLKERWVFRQVFQGGSISIARRKGAEKATIPVEMRLEKPAAGGAPFKVFIDTTRAA